MYSNVSAYERIIANVSLSRHKFVFAWLVVRQVTKKNRVPVDEREACILSAFRCHQKGIDLESANGYGSVGPAEFLSNSDSFWFAIFLSTGVGPLPLHWWWLCEMQKWRVHAGSATQESLSLPLRDQGPRALFEMPIASGGAPPQAASDGSWWFVKIILEQQMQSSIFHIWFQTLLQRVVASARSLLSLIRVPYYHIPHNWSPVASCIAGPTRTMDTMAQSA